MKRRITIFLLCQLGISVASANKAGLGMAPIDTQVLDNKRLFFSENQRQVGSVSYRGAGEKPTEAASSESTGDAGLVGLEADKLLHYTGMVRSARGVQLLLNGYPWTPGKLAIDSARLQPDTQVIEVKTTYGAIFRLLPGDAVEVRP